VAFTSNRPERTVVGTTVFAATRELVIAASRPHHRHWIVHFDGVEDRSSAEALRGAVLTATPLAIDAPGDEEDELWAHEIIGSCVVDRDGNALGTVVAVEANPAHDLLVLENHGLIPVVFVVERRDGIIVVDPPPGLLES